MFDPANFKADSLAFGVFAASALADAYADTTGGAFVRQRLLDQLAGARVAAYPAGNVMPTRFYVSVNGHTFAGFAGSTSLAAVYYQVLSSAEPPPTIDGVSSAGFWLSASQLVRAELLQFAGGPLGDVMLTGHSFGGVVASILAGWIVQRSDQSSVSLVTFGAPKAGLPNLQVLLRGASVRRYMTANDSITLLPPDPGDAPAALYFTPLPVIQQWQRYVHPVGGQVLTEEGQMIAREKPFPTAEITASRLIDFALSGSGEWSVEHILSTYLARLSRINMGFTPPTPADLRSSNPFSEDQQVADFRADIFFFQGNAGWSSTWWLTESTYLDALNRIKGLRTSLANCIGVGTELGEVRVSDITIPGDSKLEKFPRINGVFSGVAMGGWNAANLRTESGNLYRGRTFLRGFSNGQIIRSTNGNLVLSIPTFSAVTDLRNWIIANSLSTTGLRLYARLRGPDAQDMQVQEIDVVGTGYNVTFTGALPPGIARGDRLQFVNTRLYPQLRGSFLVDATPSGSVVHIRFPGATTIVVDRQLYARKVDYDFLRITNVVFSSITERKVGRPSDVPVGRRPRRALVRI